MSKCFRSVVRLSLKGFFGPSLLLLSLAAVPVAEAQLPAVMTFGNRQPIPLPSGSGTLSKVARDAQGDIFVMSISVPRIDMIPANGPAITVVPSTDPSLAPGANNVSFTVDPAGNIYPYGKYNGLIYKIPRSGTTYSLAAETTVTTNFGALNNNAGYGISDLAVDSSGNFYAGTSSGHALGSWNGDGVMMSGPSAPSGKYLAIYPAYSSPSQVLYPAAVAVDGSGNVFYVDTTRAYEITASSVLTASPTSTQFGYNGTGTCTGCTTLPSTLVNLFLDQIGNVYVASSSASSFYVIANNGSAFTTTSTTFLLPGSVSGHSGYASGTVDNQGNFIAVFGGSLERYGSNFYGAYVGGALPVATTNNGYTPYFLFTQSTTLKASGAVTLTSTGAAYGGNSVGTSSTGVTLGTVGCTAGTTYAIGANCSVGVNNKSQVPGGNNVTVSLLGTSGNTLANFAMTTTATGPAVTVDGSSKTIGSGYTSPTGIAVDNTGAMYVADSAANAVYKYAANSTGAGTSVGTGLSNPSGVAVTSAGDVFIADTGNNRVVAISGGIQTVVSTPGYALSSPRGVAIDLFGNLYIADTGNARVLEVPSPYAGLTSTYAQVLGFTGLVSPYSIAFGPFNDVYVADKGANAVYMLGAFNTNSSTFPYVSPSTQVTVGSGFSGPTGVAVDASGTVYVTDNGNARIVKVPSVSSAYTYASQSVLVSGLNKPFGIATDTTNDLYYTDQSSPGVYFMLRSAATTTTAATIPFGSVAVNGTGNQTATVTNAGLSTSLTISSVTEPTTPFGGSTSCSSLTPGSSCTVALTYSPTTAGAATPGTLTLTDNALNVTGTTQNVSLTGAASGAVASVTMTGATTSVYGDAVSFTVTAKDASGNAAVAGNGTYTVTITGTASSSASVTLSGGTGTFMLPSLGVGTYNLSVTVATFTGTASITLSKAPLSLTATNFSRKFDVANPTFTTFYTGFANGDTSSVVSGGGPTIATTATRVSPIGNYPITLTGGSLTASNYTITLVAGNLNITGSVPQTIFFPALPAFTHGTAITLTGLSTSGLPVTYSATNGTISGSTLTITAAGATTVTAIQAGNSTFAAATSVVRSFTAQ